MITYTNVKNYLSGYLTSLGGYPDLPTFDPGPGTDDNAVDVSPDRLILLTFGPGAGLSVEYAFDQPAMQVRTAGIQMDYEDSEKLAFDVDRGLLKFDHSQMMDGVWVASITRAGGQPYLLGRDKGDRYHWTCNYIIQAKAGLDD